MSKSTVVTITTVTILILMLVVPAASAQVPPDFWSLTGNSGTTPGTHFLGTTDREALELHVEGQRGLRIEPSGRSGSNVNIIGGFHANKANPDVRGATIGGGGDAGGQKNAVTDHFGVIGGGAGNKAGNSNTPRGDAQFATVGGGKSNEAAAEIATIGGGGWVTVDFGQGPENFDGNRVFDIGGTIGGGSSNVTGTDSGNDTDAAFATVSGGVKNTASGEESAVGGGASNTSSGLRAFVGAGIRNEASGSGAVIGGGRFNEAIGERSTIGGGHFNEAHADVATIGGGGEFTADFGQGPVTFDGNRVYDVGGTVGGGSSNIAGSDDGNPLSADFTTVAGGHSNNASGNNSTIGGGGGNTASGGDSTVSGGNINLAAGDFSTIGGGENNHANSIYATVAGGQDNTADGDWATVGGGFLNYAGQDSTVGGGNANSASGAWATISGGVDNIASSTHATIGGGERNLVSEYATTISGGHDNVASGPGATVGGGADNTASGRDATIGGGNTNTASGAFSTVPGGNQNVAAATWSIAAGVNAKVAPEHLGSMIFSTSPGSHPFESETPLEFAARAFGGIRLVTGGSAVGSGGAGSIKEVVNAGQTNMSWDVSNGNRLAHALVAVAPDGINPLGLDSVSSESDLVQGSSLTFSHTVANNNNRILIVGTQSDTFTPHNCDVISSVTYNGVSLTQADSISIGNVFPECAEVWYLVSPSVGTHDVEITWTETQFNRYAGAISLYNAAQQPPEATATNAAEPASSITTSITTLTDGAWVIDSIATGSSFSTFSPTEPGQTKQYEGSNVEDPSIATGCNLPAGSGTWQCTSDVSAKANFLPVNNLDILQRLSEIPVQSWNYKTQDPAIRHIGPMAQDFYAAFGTGVDDKHIGTIDADGVALAAIQGLHQLVQEKDTQIANLEQRLATLEQNPSPKESEGETLIASVNILWLVIGVLLTTLAMVGVAIMLIPPQALYALTGKAERKNI